MFEDVRGVKLYRLENLLPGRATGLPELHGRPLLGGDQGERRPRAPVRHGHQAVQALHGGRPAVPAGRRGGEAGPQRGGRGTQSIPPGPRGVRVPAHPPGAGELAGDQNPLRSLETRKAAPIPTRSCLRPGPRGRRPARPVAATCWSAARALPPTTGRSSTWRTVGWIPVDLLLGEGRTRVTIPQEPNPRNYYFGSLDFDRVTFSKG